ncbi:MAG: TMEM175 family protein [Vulcanimicrobiaceae bacterium]
MADEDVFTLSKPRFEAFSDGVFAIAITLLILEIHLPGNASSATSPAQQIQELLGLWQQYAVYAATFATIGIMWLNHHALFRYIERITHGMVIANLFLLGTISFLPFATEVLARYGLSSVTVVYYGIVTTLIAVGYGILQQQVVVAHPTVPQGLKLWNIIGLCFYPLATLVGYFWPIIGVLMFGLLAVFYMLPRNVSAAAIRP